MKETIGEYISIVNEILIDQNHVHTFKVFRSGNHIVDSGPCAGTRRTSAFKSFSTLRR